MNLYNIWLIMMSSTNYHVLIHLNKMKWLNERRHILEVARTMMIHGHVPHHFRADTVLIACYLINRMPSSILDGVIPYNVLFPSAPLFPVSPKIFGCIYYVYDNRPTRMNLIQSPCDVFFRLF
jgi:hypothetical protein